MLVIGHCPRCDGLESWPLSCSSVIIFSFNLWNLQGGDPRLTQRHHSIVDPKKNRTGDHQSALFALLFAHSLFWHMHWLTRKHANDKTQLSASFPWGMQNCKQMTRLNSLHPSPWGMQNCKQKQKKNNPMSEALWPSRSSWFSCFFVFFVFFFCFFVFFWFFWFCWPLT